jgi:hypothetical protein
MVGSTKQDGGQIRLSAVTAKLRRTRLPFAFEETYPRHAARDLFATGFDGHQ